MRKSFGLTQPELAALLGVSRSLLSMAERNERQLPTVAFPEIRLCGKWLKEAGFECGYEINVSHQDGKIIITKSEDTLEE